MSLHMPHSRGLRCATVMAFGVWSSAGLTLLPSSSQCDCLNWMEVYNSLGVLCGQGLERYLHVLEYRTPRMTMIASNHHVGWFQSSKEGKAICKHFFMRMNHSYAMNSRIAALDYPEYSEPKTWCYVPRAC